jgi:hypothetical protein
MHYIKYHCVKSDGAESETDTCFSEIQHLLCQNLLVLAVREQKSYGRDIFRFDLQG